MNGKLEQPERNKVVLERNNKIVALLSQSEAQRLKFDLLHKAGTKITNERKPVAVSNVPQVVSTFTTQDGNAYKLYAL